MLVAFTVTDFASLLSMKMGTRDAYCMESALLLYTLVITIMASLSERTQSNVCHALWSRCPPTHLQEQDERGRQSRIAHRPDHLLLQNYRHCDMK